MTKAFKAVTFDGRTYTLDDHGFLDPPEQWDEQFAGGMAKLQGIYGELTDEHWQLIRYLRTKFLEERTVPLLVYACADNSMRLSRLKRLFPMGYHRGACRIAGINYEFMVRDNIWHTYESKSRQRPRYSVTPLGFLERFDEWDDGFAQGLATEWELPGGLTGRHREVIAFLRDYYRDNHNIPSIYETCETAKLSLSELRTLFPKGYRRGACLMAGLPFPP